MRTQHVTTRLIFATHIHSFPTVNTIYEGNTEVENNGYVVFKYNTHSTDQLAKGMVMRGEALLRPPSLPF
jgi:hypothetical protein